MFSRGCNINPVDEIQVLAHYFNVTKIPMLISSPLRTDKHPSCNIYSRGNKVFWKDMAKGDGGDIISLLSKCWNISYNQTLDRIHRELGERITVTISHNIPKRKKGNMNIAITIRDWNKEDEEYWNSYGVSLKILQESNVFPIKYYFINSTVYKADKKAYAFKEIKEGKVAYKIYQPERPSNFNKWKSFFHNDEISLWTQLPKKGKLCVICSSLKDALCLKNNLGIPTIALQGEGYNINDTPLNQLKKRFENVLILYDNDEAGIKNSKKLSEKTNLQEIILPIFKEGKDISDLYKAVGQPLFNSIMFDLLKNYIFN